MHTYHTYTHHVFIEDSRVEVDRIAFLERLVEAFLIVGKTMGNRRHFVHFVGVEHPVMTHATTHATMHTQKQL